MQHDVYRARIPGCRLARLVALFFVLLTGSASAIEIAPARLRPAESLAAFVSRYQAAVAGIVGGDCPASNAFNQSVNVSVATSLTRSFLRCDELARQTYAGFSVRGFARFGTGGLVEVYDQEHAFLVVGLAPGRRWAIMAIPVLRSARASLGTRPSQLSLANFERTASSYVAAIRARNCPLYFRTAGTETENRGLECARGFAPRNRLQPELAADRAARPVRIGGTADFQFFRLSTAQGHYRTLAVLRTGTTPGSLYVTVFERAF